MANTTAVYARIDTELKEHAEDILSQLGISPSSAIQMLYSQIVLRGGMPFDLRLPAKRPTAIGALSREQLGRELEKGIASIESGRTYSVDEVDDEFHKRYGI
ncbi:MAG: type II toxin-antitoxin system RelB/DinJ family antitoxin [Oscillospiraceae bacterium]|nr:type II toxin-antitoxin system RelB/DinJ family antitoxin [Oscillospiraceae bacterium]MCD7818799.1 type II toxin-antitoxin system RelB/DinJ family antitoxin [Lachnospiraceae bacterium]